MKTLPENGWASIADLCVGIEAVKNLQGISDEKKLEKMLAMCANLGQTLTAVKASWNSEEEIAKRAR